MKKDMDFADPNPQKSYPKFKDHLVFGIFLLFLASSCSKTSEFTSAFGNTHDRIWIGKEYLSVPLEDWKVENGRVHCIGTVPNSRVNLLTHLLKPEPGNFEASVRVNLLEKGNMNGSAGLLLGAFDHEDSDVRAACFFGEGVNPKPGRDQFPGWPHKISQFDNLGMNADNVLPQFNINKTNQLIQIINEKTGQPEQVFRIHGNSVQPRLFNTGTFTVKIGENENVKELKGIKTEKNKNIEKINLEF
ncbi:MAG: hypothetical protein WD431_16715 [Cyclobacteriaceae bacterium]